jgi:beta-lactamase regulating signal transducer with metallopeptidase domain
MNELLVSLSSIAPLAASALVSAIWQGTLLAVLAWACLKFFPRLSAKARSAVWLSVFVLLIGLQLVPVLARPAVEAVSIPVAHIDVRWSYAVLGLWAGFAVVRAVQLGIGVAHLRRLVVRAVEIDVPAELEAALDELAEGRTVRICTSDEIARPSVVGFFKPKILIPERLLRDLSEAELKQVLIHEVEHLRRADDWTNLLQKVALVVFPLNPALAWVERRLCAERELACDDRVLEVGNGRKAYALCLAHLAEHAMLQRGMSLALGAWEKRPELVRRVERILRGGPQALGRRIALGVSGGVMLASLFGALVLAHSPQVVSFAPAAEMAQVESLPAALPEGLKPIPVVSRDVQTEARIVPACAMRSAKKPVSQKTRMVKPQKAKRAQPVKLAEPQVKLAGLRMPAQPAGQKLLVMTEWNDLRVQQRMVLASLREGRGTVAAAVPAIYVVATPNGMVIVQI